MTEGWQSKYARILRSEARSMDAAGNIACGKGDYQLANMVWAFAQRLRDDARKLQEEVNANSVEADSTPEDRRRGDADSVSGVG